MAMRVLGAALLSAVAMFLWGYVYWGPVLNMTERLMAPLPADVELDVLAPMRGQQLPTGMYVYPGPVDMGDEAAVKIRDEKMVAGPIFHLAYSQQGVPPMDRMMFAKGLAHNFVVAVLAAILLALAAPALPRYGSRVLVLVLASLMGAIWANGSSVIWWFHTPQYGLGQIACTLGGGLLMALVTAAIIKPLPAPGSGRLPAA